METQENTEADYFKRLVFMPIPDPLFDKIEALAKKEGVTVGEMAERLLRFQLMEVK